MLLKGIPDPSLQLDCVELDEIICLISTSVRLPSHYLYEV